MIMDYKNKYEQALRKARIWKDKSGMPKDKQGILDDIFPELGESEDERIKKDCIKYLDWEYQHCPLDEDRMKIEKCITWLKKRGEQEPADKVETFKDKLLELFQRFRWKGTPTNGDIIEYVDAHIQELIDTIQKSTDEEMKTLLQTEYEKGRADAIAEMQKPWDDEDEAKLKSILFHIEDVENKDVIDWLKSIKYRVQPKREWSEEDNQYLCGLIGLIEQSKAEIPITLKGKAADNCIDWLKSLRPQSRWKPSEEQLECLGYAIDKAEKDWSPLTNNRIYLTLKALKEQLERL